MHSLLFRGVHGRRADRDPGRRRAKEGKDRAPELLRIRGELLLSQDAIGAPDAAEAVVRLGASAGRTFLGVARRHESCAVATGSETLRRRKSGVAALYERFPKASRQQI
jgi:hypothetical protein